MVHCPQNTGVACPHLGRLTVAVLIIAPGRDMSCGVCQLTECYTPAQSNPPCNELLPVFVHMSSWASDELCTSCVCTYMSSSGSA